MGNQAAEQPAPVAVDLGVDAPTRDLGTESVGRVRLEPTTHLMCSQIVRRCRTWTGPPVQDMHRSAVRKPSKEAAIAAVSRQDAPTSVVTRAVTARWKPRSPKAPALLYVVTKTPRSLPKRSTTVISPGADEPTEPDSPWCRRTRTFGHPCGRPP